MDMKPARTGKIREQSNSAGKGDDMESKKKLLIADADESFRSILMDAVRDEADMEVLAVTAKCQ